MLFLFKGVPVPPASGALARWLLILGLGLSGLHPGFAESKLVGRATWDRLLDKELQGWIGADGAYSVRLSPTTVLWTFGDTVIGNRKDGARVSPKMVNNSLALQIGNAPETATMRFYWGRPALTLAPGTGGAEAATSADAFAAAGGHGAKTGDPRAFFVPEHPDSWYWPFDAAMVEGRLALFLMEIQRTPEGGVMGFQQVGSALALIDHPKRSPRRWRPRITSLPFTRLDAKRQVFWGASVMTHGGHLYVYGYDELLTTSPRSKRLVTARVPLAAPANFALWQFYDGHQFVADAAAAAPVAEGIPAEFTIRESASGDISMTQSWGDIRERGIFRRRAPNPWGPWTTPERLGNCPEEAGITGAICYSAKAHPHLRTSAGRELITYCTNSESFWNMLADDRLYFPRFLETDAP